PGTKAELGQDFRFFEMWFEVRSGVGVNDVVFTSVEGFHAHEAEVVGIGHLADEFPAIFAIFFLFPQSLLAIRGRLLFPLVNQLLDFFVFFFCLFLGKRLVVLGDQLLYLLTVNLHHVVSFDLCGLHPAFAVYPVVFLAFDVGVVALLLVIGHVVVGGFANELANLVLRERNCIGGGS